MQHSGSFTKYSGQRLNSAPMQVLNGMMRMDCTSACLQLGTCYHVNYNTVELTCELLSEENWSEIDVIGSSDWLFLAEQESD